MAVSLNDNLMLPKEKAGERLDSYNVKAVRAFAVEYRSNRATGRGFGVWGALLGIFMVYLASTMLYSVFSYRDFSIFLLVVWLGALYVGIRVAVTFFRLDTFALRDEPTLFNRKTRRVYTCRKHSDWKRPFSPWPVRVESHPWENIRGEIVGGPVPGSVPVPRHQLWLVVLDDEGNRKTKFAVGGIEQTANALRPVWEHIRRYMEEDGPPLAPGDDGDRALPLNSRRAFAQWMPILYTRAEREAMQEGWGSVIFMTFLLPFGVLFGTFTWLSWITSREPEWPNEVLDEAGPLVRELG